MYFCLMNWGIYNLAYTNKAVNVMWHGILKILFKRDEGVQIIFLIYYIAKDVKY